MRTTPEQFITKARGLHTSYNYSKTVYHRQTDSIIVICPEHGEFNVVAKQHVRTVGTVGCPVCGKEKQGKTRLTTNEFIEKANTVHNNKYDYSKSVYVLSALKLTVTCPMHGDWEVKANNHLNGRGCPDCGTESMANKQKLSTSEFIKRSKKVWGNKFNYDNTEYRDSSKHVIIICPEHGEFSQLPQSHLDNKEGCSECAIIKHDSSLPTISYLDFVKNVRLIHGNKYTYPENCDDFLQSKTQLTITCPKHGEFIQRATYHLHGKGCAACAGKNKTSKDVIDEFVLVHGDTYDYNAVEYIAAKNKVKIRCKVHDTYFEQEPDSHVHGRGCPQCGIELAATKETTKESEILERCIMAHGNTYDYSKMGYTGMANKITIICEKHGEFEQLPGNHIKGSGCPSCTCGSPSKGETELADYMESLGVVVERNRRNLIPPYEIDIYLPEFNIGIEYCGLYWHSEATGKKMDYHRMKHELCSNKGIRLLTIFEDEWVERNTIIKASLRHFVGKSPRGVYARNTTIREIEWKVAKAFLNEHHMLGCGAPGRHRVAAFDKDDNIVAVMVWGAPSDERGSTDAMEMKRYVCTKYNHPGVASKLFKWSVNEYNLSKVIAFVDLRFFEGAFKLSSGFKRVSESKPTLFWTDGIIRVKRRHHTKKTLLAMEQFNDSSRTKVSMMKELGFSRIWDCGKYKFQWEKIIE